MEKMKLVGAGSIWGWEGLQFEIDGFRGGPSEEVTFEQT